MNRKLKIIISVTFAGIIFIISILLMIVLFSSKPKSGTPSNISQIFYKNMIYGSINVLLSLPEFRAKINDMEISFPRFFKYWSKTLDWENKINIGADMITKIHNLFTEEGKYFLKFKMISENFADIIYFFIKNIYDLAPSENFNLFKYSITTLFTSVDGNIKKVITLIDVGSVKLFQLTDIGIDVNLNKYKKFKDTIQNPNFKFDKQILDKCPLYLFAHLKEENNNLLDLIKTDNYHCLLLTSTKYELVGFLTFDLIMKKIYYFIFRDDGIYRIDKEVRLQKLRR